MRYEEKQAGLAASSGVAEILKQKRETQCLEKGNGVIETFSRSKGREVGRETVVALQK